MKGIHGAGSKFLMLGAEQTIQGLNWKEAATLLYTNTKVDSSAYTYLVIWLSF
ncbi:MAG: hypothetical protein R2769_04090 [Saprospiraceae bacterium]